MTGRTERTSATDRWTIWWTGSGADTNCNENRHAQVSGPHVPLDESGVQVVKADSYDRLRIIADSAWRVREMLHLNLQRIVDADDQVLLKNVVDAINDLNASLPLSEDGKYW